jgi:hypothetical protein
MLAYVFWHWRKPEIPAVQYEADVSRFHNALAASPSPGFARSYAMAILGAPWANDSADAYEDWYLVSNSAALDPLNDAAISGHRQAPHDSAAAAAGGGTGGLYRLRSGTPQEVPRFSYWFAKPAGLSYAGLFDALRPMIEENAAVLWGRQMTLGPALEFCLHASRACTLPGDLSTVAIQLRTVWPARD